MTSQNAVTTTERVSTLAEDGLPPRPPRRFMAPDGDGPKLLAWDIETKVGLAYAFGPRVDYISPSSWLEKPGGLLCWAGKWIGAGKQAFFIGENTSRVEMLAAAWWALETATHLVSWNGASFDTKKLMAEFMREGWPPPTPCIEIDLMRVVKSRGSFVSNKLDEVSRELLGDQKVVHSGLRLWIDCQAGDEKAWREMRRYNTKDVTLLEPLFEHLRPWLKKQLWYSADGCPVCASKNLTKRGVEVRGTQGKEVQRFSCSDCGAQAYEPLTLIRKTLRVG